MEIKFPYGDKMAVGGKNTDKGWDNGHSPGDK